jgi:hypothetical protein
MAKRSGVRWKSVGVKEEERLTAGLVNHRSPAWSVDGRWLAMFAGDHEPTWVVARAPPGRKMGSGAEVWMATTPASPPVRLLGGDGRIYRHPAFSPDGKQLAFTCAEHGDTAPHLFVLDLAGGARRALQHDPGRADAWPSFAPSGSELIFEGRGLDGEVGCWALDLEHDTVARVSVSGLPSHHPAPLTNDLIVVERPGPNGSELVLIDRKEVRERSLSVEDPALRELRDPAACRSRSGKLRLAFAARIAESGALPRFDVCAARMRGIGLDGEAEEAEGANESASEDANENENAPVEENLSA